MIGPRARPARITLTPACKLGAGAAVSAAEHNWPTLSFAKRRGGAQSLLVRAAVRLCGPRALHVERAQETIGRPVG